MNFFPQKSQRHSQRGSLLLEALVAMGLLTTGVIIMAATTKNNVISLNRTMSGKKAQSTKAILPATLAHGVNRYLSTLTDPCQGTSYPSTQSLETRLTAYWAALNADNIRFQYIKASEVASLPSPLNQRCARASAAKNNDVRARQDLYMCLRATAPPAGADKNGQSFLAGAEAYIELHVALQDFYANAFVSCDAFAKSHNKGTQVYYSLMSRKAGSKTSFTVDNGEIFGKIDIPYNMVIAAFYKLILHRTASEAELDGWADQMQEGLSRQQVAVEFLLSDENITNVMTQVFKSLLNRSPTAAELVYVIPATRALGQADMMSQLASLSETYAASGNVPANYIQRVYQLVLGRAASSAEVNNWINFVTSQAADTDGLVGFQSEKSRRRMADAIVNSHEENLRLVTTWYQQYLQRSPGAAELNSWTTVLDTGGMSRETVLSMILGSDEFNTTFYQ